MKKRNKSIQIIRIVAMFMIAMDHILFHCNFPLRSIILQIMNSGVFIFLFISGCLYGGKKIENWKNWFLRRIIRIMIPFWVFIIIDFVIEKIVWNYFEAEKAFAFVFNLQGFLGTTKCTQTLWFLTLIMICYLLTPILYAIKRKKIKSGIVVFLVLIFLMIQILISFSDIQFMVYGHTLGWCLLALGIYGLGFFAGEKILSIQKKKLYICIMTLIMIASSSLVLLAHKLFDGTSIYSTFAWYGIIIIDFWIILILNMLGKMKFNGKAEMIINYLDGISYEFYLVHNMVVLLISGVVLEKVNVIVYVLIAVVTSLLAAIVLNHLDKPLVKKLLKDISEE